MGEQGWAGGSWAGSQVGSGTDLCAFVAVFINKYKRLDRRERRAKSRAAKTERLMDDPPEDKRVEVRGAIFLFSDGAENRGATKVIRGTFALIFFLREAYLQQSQIAIPCLGSACRVRRILVTEKEYIKNVFDTEIPSK